MTELMEKSLSRENMMQAYKKVKAKNGASGVDGIHLYTMNNAYVARKISEAVSGVIGAEREA